MRVSLQNFCAPLRVLFSNPTSMILRNLPLRIPGHTCQRWPFIYSNPSTVMMLPPQVTPPRLDFTKPGCCSWPMPSSSCCTLTSLFACFPLLSHWCSHSNMNEQGSLREEPPVPCSLSVTAVGWCVSPWVTLWLVYPFLRYDTLIFLVLVMPFNSVPQAVRLEILSILH